MNIKDRELWVFLFSYLKRKKGKAAIMTAATLILVGIQVYVPIIWGKFISALAIMEAKSITYYVLILAFFMLLELIAQYWQTTTVTYLMKTINVEMQNDLYSALLDVKLDYYDKSKSAEFITRIETDITRIVEIVINSFIPCIMSIISILSMSVIMLYMNWLLAASVIAFFPLTVYIYGKQINILRENQEKIKQKQEKLMAVTQQTVTGIRFIKLMNTKEENRTLFYQCSEDLNSKILELKQKIINVGCLNGVVMLVSQSILHILGGIFVWKQIIGIEHFITFYKYTQAFKSSSKSLVEFTPNVQEVIIALKRVYGIECNKSIAENYGKQEKTVEKGEIVIRNLTFSYNESKNILENINVKFYSNNLNIITGESGAGKTTLINLIAKLYNVSNNTIFIDGLDINEYSETALRNAISIVSQEHFLFNMSILDNFKIINPNITEYDIKNICKRCKMDKYITSLKDGYKTIIHENLCNFSVGQKQRLSIARALVRKSKILILDEPTSALDTLTKEEIIYLLNEVKEYVTVIAITHDRNLIDSADVLYELN